MFDGSAYLFGRPVPALYGPGAAFGGLLFGSQNAPGRDGIRAGTRGGSLPDPTAGRTGICRGPPARGVACGAPGGPCPLAATAAPVLMVCRDASRGWMWRIRELRSAERRRVCAGGASPLEITASTKLLGGRVAACRVGGYGRACPTPGGVFSLGATAAPVLLVYRGASRGWVCRVREMSGAWPSGPCASPHPRGGIGRVRARPHDFCADPPPPAHGVGRRFVPRLAFRPLARFRTPGPRGWAGGRPHDSSRIRPPGARGGRFGSAGGPRSSRVRARHGRRSGRPWGRFRGAGGPECLLWVGGVTRRGFPASNR